ncbi:MAG: OmpA family protein, partial [Acidobacteriota bacterium]
MLALTACGPKQEPVTTPPPAEPTPAPTEVEPPPAPSPNRDMQEEPRPVDIETLQRELERSGVIGDVFFEFDSYELRAEARERIARNAEFLNGADGRELKVRLEGHCDERGTNEYNL